MILAANLRGWARLRVEASSMDMDARASRRLEAMASFVEVLSGDDERLGRLTRTLSFDTAGTFHEIYGENLRREFAGFGYAPNNLDSFDGFLDRLVVAAKRDVVEAAP